MSPEARLLRRWARRLRALLLLRETLLAVAWLAALALPAVAAAAWLLGPAPAPWLRWLLVGALLLAGLWGASRAARRLGGLLRGTAFLERVRPAAPRLAGQLRSALELLSAPPAGASPTLLAAHLRAAASSARGVPPSGLVRWRPSRRELLRGAGPLLGALLALGLLATPRARGGLYALAAGSRLAGPGPAGGREASERVALWAHQVEVRVVPPAYSGWPPARLEDPARLELLAGSTVTLRLASSLAAEGVEVRLGEERWAARPLPGGGFEARFRVLSGGALRLVATDAEGRRWRDARPRRVVLRPDEPPTVLAGWAGKPAGPVREAAPDGLLKLRWRAEDDLGLGAVRLVVGLRGGPPRRLPLWPEGEGRLGARRAEGLARLVLAEVGATEGDLFEVLVEAEDLDDVRGPKVGRSRPLLLAVPSEADRLARLASRLLALRGQVLDALAWEMEPPGARAPRAGAEARRLARGARGPVRERTPVPFEEVEGAVRRALAEEGKGAWRRAARRALRRLRRGRPGEAERVEALEALALALDEAVRELTRRELRRRVQQLARLEEAARRAARALSERPDDPDRRRALQEAAARLQQRMGAAGAARARTALRLPDAFRNPARRAEEQARYEALAELREAARRGDAEAALRAAEGVRQELERLAQALRGADEEPGGGGEGGRRARKLAEAVRRLAGLEREQGALLQGTSRARREAVQRALRSLREQREGLAELRGAASRAAEASRALGRERLGEADRSELRSAAEQLQEAAEALGSGEVGEALRFAEEAEARLAAVARSLRLEATMFPGHGGETARAAKRAERVAAEARRLRDRLERTVVEAAALRDGAPGAEARRDAERQQRLRGRVGEVARALQEVGVPPKRAPAIEQSMEAAERALRQGEVLAAERRQRESLEALAAWRRELERASKGGGGGGGGGQRERARRGGGSRQGGGGGDGVRTEEAIRIPLQQRPEGRRFLERLREAMREEVDPAHEETVRAYYEALTR